MSRWMPFISRKRMDIGIPLRKGGPDLAMLFFAMKLVTLPLEPGESPSRNPTYCIAKKYLADLEANGDVSLLCLQAMILVALYEYGHGVYPAAWITVGSCARYADMLEIKPGEENTAVLGNWASSTPSSLQ